MAGSKVDLKVVLLGKAYAGKTSVVDRFIHNRFSTLVLSNIGAAFGAKRIDVGNKHVVLGIWDTAGSERFEAMSRIYFRGAKAAILCFDLTDKSSFDRVHFWIEELRTHEEDCKIYLCGTKKDLVVEDPIMRRVNKKAAKTLADDCMAEIFETSSKTGENIVELFTQIASDYLESTTPLSPQKTTKLRDVQKSSCVCKGS